MTSHPQPTLNPENNLNETFNANAFSRSYAYATLADLLNYGNLYFPNNWSSINTFAALNAESFMATNFDFSGTTFVRTINNVTTRISSDTFALINYLPNLISELANITYDSTRHITTISETTQMTDTNVTDNLNVGSNINCDAIVNTSLVNQTISTNSISCNQLNINNTPFYDIGCIVYINNLSMPIMKFILIENFNIKTINTVYITVKAGYRIDFSDSDGNILFSYTNDTDNYAYYIQVPYNTDMKSISLYCKNNILIV